MKREAIITVASNTHISVDTHLLFLCQMLDAVLTDSSILQYQQSLFDAA